MTRPPPAARRAAAIPRAGAASPTRRPPELPLYEYRRPDGSTFDVVQSFSEDALTHDPETGEPVERVLHAPAIHFKGKGFYSTDVGREKQRKLLAREAERGANEHDEKFRAKMGAKVRANNSPTATKAEKQARRKEI